jgi:hypothetical protein
MRREAAPVSRLIHDDVTGRSVETVGFQYAPVDFEEGKERAEIEEGAEIEAGIRQLIYIPNAFGVKERTVSIALLAER